MDCLQLRVQTTQSSTSALAYKWEKNIIVLPIASNWSTSTGFRDLLRMTAELIWLDLTVIWFPLWLSCIFSLSALLATSYRWVHTSEKAKHAWSLVDPLQTEIFLSSFIRCTILVENVQPGGKWPAFDSKAVQKSNFLKIMLIIMHHYYYFWLLLLLLL